ncbi:MAG: addiction module protein [Desulfomonilaceae bacterium]
MTEAVEELKSQLETLTSRERAELAQFLIRSLDQEQDEGAESLWNVELNRRATEIESGKSVGKPAEQVFAELREKYS